MSGQPKTNGNLALNDKKVTRASSAGTPSTRSRPSSPAATPDARPARSRPPPGAPATAKSTHSPGNSFKRITEEMAALKEKKALILAQQEGNSAANRRIQDAVNLLNAGSAEITEWDKDMIRQLVDTVKVLSADRIRVYLRGGMEIDQIVGGQ